MTNQEKYQNESGVPHWKWQRRSALVLIPLVLWVLVSIVHHIGLDYDQTKTWLAHPVVAFLMIVFIASLFYHAKLGLQVIFEDYISDPSTLRSILSISNLVCWLAMFLGMASILKIVLGS